MGDAMHSDLVISRSGNRKGRKTMCTRFAWFLCYVIKKFSPDACLAGHKLETIDSVLACYVSSLIQKHNIQSKTIRSNTLTNYLSAVRIAFDDAKLPFPQKQIPGGGKAKQIIAEVKRWEKVANLRNPVSDEMFAYLLRLHASHCE